jgi:hypothetical protein
MSAKMLCGAGLGAALTVAALSSPAAALETYTYVNGTGNDANACTRAAPCRTVHEAHSKTEPGGEIVILGPGYYSSITITKSITVTGVPGAILRTAQIHAGASDVVILSGLQFNPQGVGLAIRLLSASKLLIDDCLVNADDSTGILIDPPVRTTAVISNSTITTGAWGIRITPKNVTASVVLNDVQIDRMSDDGVHAEGSAAIILNDSTITLSNQALSASGGATIYSMGNNAIVGNTSPGTAPVPVPLK